MHQQIMPQIMVQMMNGQQTRHCLPVQTHMLYNGNINRFHPMEFTYSSDIPRHNRSQTIQVCIKIFYI